MLKSLFVELLLGVAVYIGVSLMLIGLQWVGRSRRPKGRVFRWIRRLGLGKHSEGRAAEVLAVLTAHTLTGAELPDAKRLCLRLEDHRFSALSILLVWLFPGLGLGVCLVLLNGEFAQGQPWLMALVWGAFGAVMVLCEVDRRMLARSLPLEHTTLMAVCAVEACEPSENQVDEVRGYTRATMVCGGIDRLCAALARHAEVEPRRTDSVHRARLRAQAQEVVRNLHAAKVRLLEGDQDALADLCTIIASLLARTVAPANAVNSTRPLVAAEVLTADPEWQGPPPSRESAGANLLGFGVFIAAFVAVGWGISLLNIHEALVLPLAAITVTGLHRALSGRVPLPALPMELRLTAPPTPAPDAPSAPGEAAGRA
ncbi:hypothetical protein ACIRP0_31415 [Streptomyces sp. NPDC101733]|uniref:hypothetical protein n=1 Tax=unclassified Streptomyces TaxID=2593676 RepID=UPI0037FA4742